jgi:mono/diheme cytochrome c family protein
MQNRTFSLTSRMAALTAGTGLLGLASVWSSALPWQGVKAAAKPHQAAAARQKNKQVAAAASLPAGKLQYNRDIRPILAENCFPCHGPDSAARKAGLRLDRFADATAKRDGKYPIAPGRPQESDIINRVYGRGPIMPPVASHKKLTPEQKATLAAWVKQGAAYEAHWSYIPPKRPALPAVRDAAWVRNPVDRFILAKLEAAGLRPAPEADRRTLARRLSLDLTGLPPDPADVEAFAADKSPTAYEKLVDRYMATPQWGEHRARYWLDAARYADTHGIHFDNYREVWAYRDWVIEAFNRNMPFDQFTIEQLAGDLLPNPTLDQKVATGFTRCNITTNEGGAIDEEYLVLYARDRTETAAQIWLGTTAGCAVCHDHKFDPLSMRDFYSMSAFFNNTNQRAMDGNIKDTPPIIPVPMAADRARYTALQSEIPAARKAAESRKAAARADFSRWLAGSPSLSTKPTTDALSAHLALSEGKGAQLTVNIGGETTAAAAPGAAWVDGHVADKALSLKSTSDIAVPNIGDFENNQSFTVAAWVKVPAGNTGGAVVARMDESNDFRGWDLWLEGNKVGTHIIHKWPGDAVKVVSREALTPNVWHHVAISYNGGLKKEGIKVYIDGAEKATDPQADALKGSIRTSTPFKIGRRSGSAAIPGLAVQDIRLYTRVLAPAEVANLRAMRSAYLISLGPEKLKPAQTDELFTTWLEGEDEIYRDLRAKLAALEGEEAVIRGRGTTAHVASEKETPPEAYILFRGDYDKRRDKVGAATPASLPPMPADLPKNRLGFAKWLLLPEHPLTARVTVNRFWQELFGNGLVKSAGDFGIMGELPSHPELLDWLAVEFRENGWDIKKFFRLLVTSSTYRQAAVLTPEKKAKDPANRLLSRGPRYRMDGEMVRDYALAASGLLVKKIGGPSVKPYQPDGVWEAVAMIGSNTRDYRRDTGENLYRRSMYTFWKRAAPPASMEIFNAPNRETCVVKRERTNTPLQALVTLNDVQFVEAARNLAERAIKEGGPSTSRQIDYIARRLLARPLKPAEAAIVARSLAELQSHFNGRTQEAQQLISYGESKADPALKPEALAAMTMLVNQMMNLDEVINK